MNRTRFFSAAGLVLAMAGVLAGQEPLDEVVLEELRATTSRLLAEDPDLAHGAWRDLEDRLNALGTAAPDHLRAVIRTSPAAVRPRLGQLLESLDRYIEDDAVFGLFDKLGVPAVTGLPRVRVHSGVWRRYGDGPWEPVWRSMWLVREEADELICLDDAGAEHRMEKAKGPRRVLPDPKRSNDPHQSRGPFDEETREAGVVIEVVSFREEVAREMGREQVGWAPKLAWTCKQRGLHVQAATLLERWRQTVSDGPEEVRRCLLQLQLGEAFCILGEGGPRAQAATYLERALAFADEKQAPHYRRLAADVRAMALEDAGHVPPTPGASLDERVRHLVFELRNTTPDGAADPGGAMLVLWDHPLAQIGRPALPHLIAAMDDERPTRSFSWWRSWAPESYRPISIGHVAGELLSASFGRYMTKAEWEAWWLENRDRTEAEWFLDDLGSTNDAGRLFAIRRLLAFDSRAHGPAVLASLQRFAEPSSLASAIACLHVLAEKDRAPAILPYLDDRRFAVSFAAARSLVGVVRRKAIDVVCVSLESDRGQAIEDVGSVADWLLGTGDDLAREAVFYVMKHGSTFDVRQDVIQSVCKAASPGALEALLRAFDDREERQLAGSWNGVSIVDPRVADFAGIAVTRLLGITDRFNWCTSRFQRDRHLEQIRRIWRARSQGLPDPESRTDPALTVSVHEILPALTSPDSARRATGADALAALGPGAWVALGEARQSAKGSARRRLDAVRLDFANRVRHVKSGPIDLSFAVGRKLDLAELRQRIMEPFSRDHALHGLRIELARAAEGAGIDISLEVTRGPVRAGEPRCIGYRTAGSAGAGAGGQQLILSLWDTFATSLQRRLREPAGEPAWDQLRLEKRWE